MARSACTRGGRRRPRPLAPESSTGSSPVAAAASVSLLRRRRFASRATFPAALAPCSFVRSPTSGARSPDAPATPKGVLIAAERAREEPWWHSVGVRRQRQEGRPRHARRSPPRSAALRTPQAVAQAIAEPGWAAVQALEKKRGKYGKLWQFPAAAAGIKLVITAFETSGRWHPDAKDFRS